jgi:hypothetical protein
LVNFIGAWVAKTINSWQSTYIILKYGISSILSIVSSINDISTEIIIIVYLVQEAICTRLKAFTSPIDVFWYIDLRMFKPIIGKIKIWNYFDADIFDTQLHWLF